MNELIEAPTPVRNCNLILHCGAHPVNRKELELIPTPAATSTWCPVGHVELLQTVEHALGQAGLRVITEAHGMTREGDRYFGLLQVANGHNHPDYSWVVGVRNSHDKSLPCGIVAGTSVMVCDNLSFSGEVKLSRKHTIMIRQDLPLLAKAAVGKLVDKWHTQDQRIDVYKNCALKDWLAHDLVIKALDAEVIPSTKVPQVLHEWRDPRHREFAPRNIWSLHNAFTQVLKGNLPLLPGHTERLHALLDDHVGLAN